MSERGNSCEREGRISTSTKPPAADFGRPWGPPDRTQQHEQTVPTRGNFRGHRGQISPRSKSGASNYGRRNRVGSPVNTQQSQTREHTFITRGNYCERGGRISPSPKQHASNYGRRNSVGSPNSRGREGRISTSPNPAASNFGRKWGPPDSSTLHEQTVPTRGNYRGRGDQISHQLQMNEQAVPKRGNFSGRGGQFGNQCVARQPQQFGRRWMDRSPARPHVSFNDNQNRTYDTEGLETNYESVSDGGSPSAHRNQSSSSPTPHLKASPMKPDEFSPTKFGARYSWYRSQSVAPPVHPFSPSMAPAMPTPHYQMHYHSVQYPQSMMQQMHSFSSSYHPATIPVTDNLYMHPSTGLNGPLTMDEVMLKLRADYVAHISAMFDEAEKQRFDRLDPKPSDAPEFDPKSF